MHQFQYEPINLEGHSFRLLRLCKADYDTVQCELVLAYLDDSSIMEYEALSYAWEGTDKPDVIEVNGCFVSVTRSLSLALRNLRYRDRDRFLWVDAICIDQTNDKERGHQVNQMGAIYKKAKQVLIWLGPATPKTNLVFGYMSLFDEESIKFACREWDVSDKQWQRVLSPVLALHGDGERKPKLAQEGLEELLTRPWFDRVWIIQEVANARAARVVCGAKSVLARTFALFPHLLGVPRGQNCQAILDIMPGPTRNHSWWTKNHDLGTLLLKFRGSQASEPRDKIYALLGIASDRPTNDLPVPIFPAPNYEKDEVAAVQDTIRFLLQLHTVIEGRIYSPTWTLAVFMRRLDQLTNETCIQAAGDGSVATVKFLLETRKANPDFKNTEGQTPLLRAAERGHESIVKLLLDTKKAEPDFKNMEGQTPLLRAAEEGHESIVRILLDTKVVDINVQDKGGQTPLLRAAERGHESIVKLLLKTKKANPCLKNTEGQTPLLRAAEKGHESIVGMLLDSGEELVEVWNNNRQTPLARATRNRHTRVVRLLVERGKANVNARDIHGRTPLIEASMNGDEAAVKCILDTGLCYTEGRDKNLWSPFTTAVISGHEAVVRRLLQTKETRPSTFAQKAALEKERKLAFQLFQTYEADRNSQKIYFSQHPIAAAVITGNMTLLELFLETAPLDLESTYIGADYVGVCSFIIGTAFWSRSEIPLILWAARNGLKRVVEVLLGTVKTELTSHSVWAQGLLRLAVEDEDDRLIRLVVAKHRANVLQYGLSGPKLLGIARKKGNVAVIEALIDSGWSDKLSKADALLEAATDDDLLKVGPLPDTDKAYRYLDILHAWYTNAAMFVLGYGRS